MTFRALTVSQSSPTRKTVSILRYERPSVRYIRPTTTSTTTNTITAVPHNTVILPCIWSTNCDSRDARCRVIGKTYSASSTRSLQSCGTYAQHHEVCDSTLPATRHLWLDLQHPFPLLLERQHEERDPQAASHTHTHTHTRVLSTRVLKN